MTSGEERVLVRGGLWVLQFSTAKIDMQHGGDFRDWRGSSVLARQMKPHADTNDWPGRLSSHHRIRGSCQTKAGSYEPQEHKFMAVSPCK